MGADLDLSDCAHAHPVAERELAVLLDERAKLLALLRAARNWDLGGTHWCRRTEALISAVHACEGIET